VFDATVLTTEVTENTEGTGFFSVFPGFSVVRICCRHRKTDLSDNQRGAGAMVYFL
jgi:hypothetical protein